MNLQGGFSLEPIGTREIAIARRFAASRALVFRAWTEPAIVRRWLTGPPGWAMPVCEIDLKVGGALRYVWRHDDGREMGMSGSFLEIAPAVRLVHSELFDEDWTGGEARVTTNFAEAGGGTTVQITVLYASTEARDAAARSGMEEGITASYDRLDDILALDVLTTQLVEVGQQTALVVRKTVEMSGMGAAQHAARPLLDAALRDAGLSGPRLTVWRSPQDGRIDYAPGVLIAQPLPVQGEVSLLTIPAGRAAHLCFQGGYEGLPAAWARLFGDCKKEGWRPDGLNWEVYTETTPAPVTDLYALLDETS